MIVFLVGCAAFDRFKAEFLRLKMLASIDVDFNHTKEDEADDEVSDEEKNPELHYAADDREDVAKIEDEDESKFQMNAKQNFEKMMQMINDTMTETVDAAKREMMRIEESIRKHNAFDKMWKNEEDVNHIMEEDEDHVVI